MSAAMRTVLVASMALAAGGLQGWQSGKGQGSIKLHKTAKRPGMPVAGAIWAEGFGAVSAGASLGWYEEDHTAWRDLPGSRFVNVPEWLVGVTALVPGHRLAAKTQVEFHCPKKSTIRTHKLEACDAFVFLYRCPPCVVERARLEQQLVADGWAMSGCGLDFKSGAANGNGYPHRMMVLRKQLAPDSSVSFTTPDKVIEYAAFGLSSAGTDCGAVADPAACDGAREGACAWDYTTNLCLHTNFCRRPSGPQGNGVPKCLVCPNEELAAARVFVSKPR